MSDLQTDIDELALEWPQLAAELAPIRTLERLLDWFKSRGIDLSKLELIQQDEFCFDLLAPFDDRSWITFAMS